MSVCEISREVSKQLVRNEVSRKEGAWRLHERHVRGIEEVSRGVLIGRNRKFMDTRTILGF